MSFLDFLRTNLLHVLPILVCGAFAIAIIVERYKTLYVALPLTNAREFFDRIGDLVSQGSISEAVQYCDRFGEKPVARVVKSALQRSHLPDEAISQGVQLTLSDAVHGIQKRTGYLATIANVATLLGLFGTIAGLIHSFEAVSHADPQQKAAMLSAGIATAMNATMMGLGLAIPCMIAFSVLINKSNRLTSDLEEAATRSMDILQLRYFKVAGTSAEKTNGKSAEVIPLKAVSNGHADRKAA